MQLGHSFLKSHSYIKSSEIVFMPFILHDQNFVIIWERLPVEKLWGCAPCPLILTLPDNYFMYAYTLLEIIIYGMTCSLSCYNSIIMSHVRNMCKTHTHTVDLETQDTLIIRTLLNGPEVFILPYSKKVWQQKSLAK